ncbi:hypothetical protein PHPALM_27788 [Phytophthora palmivora]|uniref:Uncharacterized protein n=1 Tax=Phytophthora palmivora TaxID=4796 RepID=A0A2P4XBR5_9STRA|nr:hypothetical protein PHPALM_27788 [Phytophthora palmivora]
MAHKRYWFPHVHKQDLEQAWSCIQYSRTSTAQKMKTYESMYNSVRRKQNTTSSATRFTNETRLQPISRTLKIFVIAAATTWHPALPV